MIQVYSVLASRHRLPDNTAGYFKYLRWHDLNVTLVVAWESSCLVNLSLHSAFIVLVGQISQGFCCRRSPSKRILRLLHLKRDSFMLLTLHVLRILW